ncbi:unnamed protein product [Schistosoma rodhaini]|uniref:UBL3-like ubiquitin domain-containing protein n=1 Tax=Schistosoma rodhaini TaxID=6188 RepID=A0AA85G2P9_9TREM|nr:unnamed protein product [Schistosoma rodhaini]CAH8593761.1 unnamed protein product [Schistosoma rodhaini]
MPDGSFFEHKYDQDTTVEQITSSLFNDWPDCLGKRPDSNHLKLIFQGRFLLGALKLSGMLPHEYFMTCQYNASTLRHVLSLFFS